MEPTTTDQAAETAAAAPEKAKTEEKAAPAAETKAPAQASDAKRPAKAPQGKKGNRHGDHRGNGDRHNSRGHDHPAPMGALQQALKKTSGDWKAFRDAQIAEGRSQKSFWLTENEAERVRRFIHQIREKAEREAARQAEIAARKGKAGSKPKQADKPVQKSVPNPVKKEARAEAAAAVAAPAPEAKKEEPKA